MIGVPKYGIVLDQDEAAKFFGTTTDVIINLINNKNLSARKIGDKYFIKKSELYALLANPDVGLNRESGDIVYN